MVPRPWELTRPATTHEATPLGDVETDKGDPFLRHSAHEIGHDERGGKRCILGHDLAVSRLFCRPLGTGTGGR